MIEFTPFPKIPRLSRECVITEELDGTNASVTISREFEHVSFEPCAIVDGHRILAGSRSRFITPEDDNFGFAKWVKENAEELVELGPGTHWGEWWGSGIQRGYGLPKGEKRFSLFNTGRWVDLNGSDIHRYIEKPGMEFAPWCCHVVPVLWRGDFSDPLWNHPVMGVLKGLEVDGSIAAPGFMDPEGIMIYHTAANQYFKKTIKGDEKGKGR